MKNLISITLFVLLFLSCGGNSGNKQAEEVALSIDKSVVNVFYFHGKQRCKTCLAIEKVAKQTITESYTGNLEVKFVEVNIDDKKNKALTEKYQIAFSSLLIAKGEDFVDITEQAFANAVNAPTTLRELIKQEVDKRIEMQ